MAIKCYCVLSSKGSNLLFSSLTNPRYIIRLFPRAVASYGVEEANENSVEYEVRRGLDDVPRQRLAERREKRRYNKEYIEQYRLLEVETNEPAQPGRLTRHEAEGDENAEGGERDGVEEVY